MVWERSSLVCEATTTLSEVHEGVEKASFKMRKGGANGDVSWANLGGFDRAGNDIFIDSNNWKKGSALLVPRL